MKKNEKQAKTSKPTKKMAKEKRDLTDVKNILLDLKAPLTIINDAVKLLKDAQKETPNQKQEQLLLTIEDNVERIGALLNGLAMNHEHGDKRGLADRLHFDIMTQIQQVCSTHDILFLQKQLHYHISASADLPKVYANPEQILLVLSNLVANAIKYAPRGSDIEIKIVEVSLRQGAGIEITVVNVSEDFTERDRYHIFEKFYSTKATETTRNAGFGLSMCREVIQHSHGQLWVDIPSKGKVAFAFVLPCAEIEGDAKVVTHQTYKYDITVANYEELKNEFGSEKSQTVLTQIEHSVRQLVRYPVDVVTAFEQSGIISTIYETQEGNASSVAARISQKLGSEEFRIGKNEVSLTFQYRLSALQ